MVPSITLKSPETPTAEKPKPLDPKDWNVVDEPKTLLRGFPELPIDVVEASSSPTKCCSVSDVPAKDDGVVMTRQEKVVGLLRGFSGRQDEGNDESEGYESNLDKLRKAGVAVVGGTMTAVGLAMVPLPTPFGCVIAAAGMSVLGTEFPKAQEVLETSMAKVQQGIETIKSQQGPITETITSLNDKFNTSINTIRGIEIPEEPEPTDEIPRDLNIAPAATEVL